MKKLLLTIWLSWLMISLVGCATTGQVKTFQDQLDKEEVSSLIRDKQLAIALESLMKSYNEHLIILHGKMRLSHEN